MGVQNPLHAYLQPVLQELYGDRTLALLVARDPRDICTGKNQGQFHALRDVQAGCDGLNSSCVGDCFDWWAGFWRDLFLGDGSMTRFLVIRIEDLVTPNPKRSSTSINALGCIARQLGMKYSREPAVQALSEMHVHASSYLGTKRLMEAPNQTRAAISAVAAPGRTHLHTIMQLLGYGIDGYHLIQPGSTRVCQ